MSAVAILTAARARIADPAHWTTGVYARAASGTSIDPQSPLAVCWCALGAIDAEGWVFFNRAAALLRRAAVALHGMAVTAVNDALGHAAVLAMYDRAIALAAEAEAR